MAKNNPINGWIVLDKPSGITSAHAVNKVKRLLKPDKIGHAGTLDPLASGILPLALGEATKTVAYMMDAAKAYSFTVTWGQERDTDDSQGQVTSSSASRPTIDDIKLILNDFIGEIEQTPPNYSAIKVDGKRAYDMAREGEALELKSRRVRVDSLQISSPSSLVGEGRGEGAVPPTQTPELVERTPLPNPLPQGERGLSETSFICHCGKGTYIRSLARDMGRKLECFGYVTVLRRLKVGKFSENHAISLEMLEEMVHKGGGFLHPVDSALDDILALDITPHQAVLIKHGQTLSFPQFGDNDAVLVRCEGTPVAMCSITQGVVKPLRVFNL